MSETISGLSPSVLWRQLGLARHNWPGRFTFLLATIMLLLVSEPIFSSHAIAQNLATVAIALVLLTAMYAFRSTWTYFTIALILIFPAIGCRVALQFTVNPTLEMICSLSSCLFIVVTVVALVSRLFNVRTVTVETIAAAICAYMLMGIAWAYAFAVIELAHPGSFSTALLQKTPGNVAPLLASFKTFIYYSFVCLTTMGFGDITPVSDGARSLSAMEAVFGQLYLAILIARLVSMGVAESMTKKGD